MIVSFLRNQKREAMAHFKKATLAIPILILTAFYSCNNNQRRQQSTVDSTTVNQTAEKDNYLITCKTFGKVDRNDGEKALKMKFGEMALKRDSFFKEGMFEEMITTVNAGKDDEFQVHWNDVGIPKLIVVSQPNSPYHLSNGIKIGATLKELVNLNHAAISFYGFGWDYGGTISGFNKGVMENQYPCFSGVLDGAGISADQLVGDKVFSSDLPGVDTEKINLKEMRIELR